MFIAYLWHKTSRNILFLPLMKRATLKHILFTMLTTVMCLGFSSYVVLSRSEIAKEINVSINEEDSETAENSVNEISSFYMQEELPLNVITTVISAQLFHHYAYQLLDFSLIPNTPPPNLV